MAHEHIKVDLRIHCLLLFTFAGSETGAARLRLKKFSSLAMRDDTASVDSHEFASPPIVTHIELTSGYDGHLTALVETEWPYV